MPRTPQETLKKLNGQRFLADAVMAAARIDGDTLTNYTRKTELSLCSESLQGRPRHFCLVDVYQLALMAQIASVTRAPKIIAHGLNDLLFIEMVILSQPEERPQIKGRVCADIFAAPKPYWHRDLKRPIFASSFGRGASIDWDHSFPEFDDPMYATQLVMNMTYVLHNVDGALFDATHFHAPRPAVPKFGDKK